MIFSALFASAALKTVLVVYGAALAAICCIFHTVGISLGFLVKIFGCLMGGGSFPMASIVLWDGTSTPAARWSPILALCSSLITWIVTTKARSGVITVTSLGDSYNSLAGDAVALGVGPITVVLLSLIFPDKKPFTIDGVACEDENTNAKELDKEENDPEKLQQDTSRPYNIEESADDAITSHFRSQERAGRASFSTHPSTSSLPENSCLVSACRRCAWLLDYSAFHPVWLGIPSVLASSRCMSSWPSSGSGVALSFA